ncbi:MAG: 23S rRNA (adenine(2503)-C(2))-methyltransferase RlmN [Fibrobacterota bacterium]
MLNICACTLHDVLDYLQCNFGKGRYHSEAVYKTFYKTGSTQFEYAKEFAHNHSLAENIRSRLQIPPIKIVARKQSKAAEKITFRLVDGHHIESVILFYPRRITLCISSQVGCRWACRFCSTGTMGFHRNLTVSEIVWQVYAAIHILKIPVRNVVFMGMGEPLDTGNILTKAIEVMAEQRGLDIAPKNITVSTAGHIDGLKALYAQKFPNLRIALSLHSCINTTRSWLMPVNKVYPLDELRRFLENHQFKKGEEIFAEYLLITGVNDSIEHADALIGFLENIPSRINLIPFNESKNYFPLSPTTAEDTALFAQRVEKGGRRVLIRDSRGQGIQAACGQLLPTKDTL